jgi:hypothetical protein
MKFSDFTEQPYGNRRLVTFVNDEQLQSEPETDESGSTLAKVLAIVAGTGATGSGLAATGSGAASAISGVTATGTGLATGSVLVASAGLVVVGPFTWFVAKKVYDLLKEAYSKDIAVIPIPLKWASQLSLPPGHPRDKVLYAAHPVDPYTYVPSADFHRFAFEHKFAEAIRLLMHLGAKRLKINREHGWGRDFTNKLSVGIPSANSHYFSDYRSLRWL